MILAPSARPFMWADVLVYGYVDVCILYVYVCFLL
jgi:hypothetical protein